MADLFSICTKKKRASSSDMGFFLLKMYHGQKSIGDFQHNMETVLYSRRVCISG
jgi:hypothetical protein